MFDAVTGMWIRVVRIKRMDATASCERARYPSIPIITPSTAAAIISGIEVSLSLKYKADDEEMRWRMEYVAMSRLRGSGPLPNFDVVSSEKPVTHGDSGWLLRLDQSSATWSFCWT